QDTQAADPTLPETMLSVAATDGSCWVTDSNNKLWYFDNGTWRQMGPSLTTTAYHLDALEYGAIAVNADNSVAGALRRGRVVCDFSGNVWFISTWVAPLIAEFAGDMAVNPYLVGYVEGAAPVPLQNMTNPSVNYNGLSTVSYADATTTKRTWASSRDVGINSE